MKKQMMVVLAALCALAGVVSAADKLATSFATPPPSARPWVYWFPLSGNLTKEGITADLEAMARVGIGGVLYMEVDQGAPKGAADFAGPLWRELFKHACNEAHRLGLEINMNNDAGWCGSGGPWITPELSMQKVVWSETIVEGNRKFDGVLAAPPTIMNFYRDIAVMAMPLPADEEQNLESAGGKLTCSGTVPQPGRFSLPRPEAEHPQFVQVEFPQPFTARMLTATLSGETWLSLHGEVQVSDDGKAFRTVRSFSMWPPELALSFDAVTGRFFRIVLNRLEDSNAPRVDVSEVDLRACYRIDNIAGKASFRPEYFGVNPTDFPAAPAEVTIPRDQIADLSAQMDHEGRLNWDAPPGRWLVLRFGHTTTGRENHPAPESGLGLECDKFSKVAAAVHFNHLMGRLIDENRALAGQDKVLVSTHIDSWEVGSQNWTTLMRQEFQKRRGYDLLPFLPTFTGRIVDSVEVTERFLWDLRQTVSELIVENYAGEMRRLANQHGLRLSIEAYDGAPVDEMTYGGQADEPMAEFWSWDKFNAAYSCTEMASAAHTYGRKILGAEAFTALNTEKWQGHPANVKDLGDWAFCEGINRFVFHRYAAQPWTNRAPGMSMGPWGLHYERTQTWWEQSKAWHEYLARCQYLLQQGLFVADIAYLEPEGAPRRFEPPADAEIAPHIRGGHNFDGCTPEVVFTRMRVKDGRIVLPDGMSYRMLVLPPVEAMTPKLLRKIAELADAGATILGGDKPPRKSPSLVDLGAGDAEVKKLAAELWAGGKIVTGMTPAQWFAEHGIKPDFSATPNLRAIHRRIGDAEVYFVANPEPRDVDALASFRVAGRQPELWWPDTGRTGTAVAFAEKNGATDVPLRLEPNGSVFVVFRRPSAGVDPIVGVMRDGHFLLSSPPAKPATTPASDTSALDIAHGEIWQSGAYMLQTASGQNRSLTVMLPPPLELTGPWDVAFDPKWGGPEKASFAQLEDWTKRPEEGVRHYSGTAIYRKAFTVPDTLCGKDPASRLYLDLGKVAVMAEVRLNGRNLGILWKPPFRVDVTGVLRSGENSLEVSVVNLWINRQIGDEQLPEDSDRAPNGTLKAWPKWVEDGKPSPSGRYTFTSWRLWKKDDPLVESGLLGPVTVQATVPIEASSR